jgi:hypothetical protein
MDIVQYRAEVRRRAATYAVRATRQLGGEARDRALAAARNLTVFFPEARVHAVIRAAAEETRPAGSLGYLYRRSPPPSRTSENQRSGSGADMSTQLLAQLRLLQVTAASLTIARTQHPIAE